MNLMDEDLFCSRFKRSEKIAKFKTQRVPPEHHKDHKLIHIAHSILNVDFCFRTNTCYIQTGKSQVSY